ncbi:DNA-directed RNA polymerase III subunit RPC4 [Brachypodium distachyon]|uniref:RNA polymerase III subunit C4 n=1 Tax=Brachypodium distachyon TaxID=15368 RepID=A0A0Q3KQW0_BRADI|nr:DNA-directed RNA polymerase III subunit RPC4 [Brachypodium distachyon]KQJ82389.1 hypothetical protein BRADI_5g08700v3 [Brachypodium distachyon]|eukprot:XP_024311900.1 DNA-directed RNA polymerase III subunit RPC4 [Brachypodium distachyon]
MDDKGKGKAKKETDGSAAPAPRKGLKFAPKKPPKKPAKVVPKTEPVEDIKDEIIDKELLMKLKISLSTDPFGRPLNIVKKEEIHTQVAFGQENSPYARSFPTRHYSKASKAPKEYVDPWDYTNRDYPVTLPLRRPYSGDPEILDEEEFGESSASRAQDGELTAAEELGLMDRSDTPPLLLFLFPKSLPLLKQAQSVEEPNTGNKDNTGPASTISKLAHEKITGSKINDLPGGLMGKILVYKSGKVKMKIGDALFDVSPGVNCKFVQDVAAINIRENHCCTLGEISKNAVVTPDVAHLQDSVNRMEE